MEEIISSSSRKDDLLMRIFIQAEHNAVLKNTSLIAELFEISRNLRNLSLLRFSSILYESISKGSSVCEKLEREQELLRNSNLNRARAEAKKTESKLSFPLGIMLVSLMLICIAPAIMTM